MTHPYAPGAAVSERELHNELSTRDLKAQQTEERRKSAWPWIVSAIGAIVGIVCLMIWLWTVGPWVLDIKDKVQDQVQQSIEDVNQYTDPEQYPDSSVFDIPGYEEFLEQADTADPDTAFSSDGPLDSTR
ncbi:hypothetical protein [Corynebacterium aquatimens]|uniref:Uncharacterized protein n=1 Tax=Corynebacterium aquatimens TaxID=1190508 RepID=A0A931E5Q1_9CORY|nr:hypothetical protein [Corynebacterium aquatimens]MBG6122898.1 hypothetical protein [Corynebacterium aquatimens]WJY66767.1 hypothetical protein CAQUA_10400 [Corynebacterium aquatimens]